ncbi:hypothetical protein GNI_029070 [Gregarina niphandrodes]|uniref:Transmembrane protein n=1 Tax=Gregarina niphandrodes TaxID=110365 RepID=A0A023BB35_GRENI|nr:hypothetical protein GNI_029070 [Gregarina niphandrodes]EZG79151.1 hypothetical protein GNI_029070 [Gregarina niphandrodes]|eukprot:XP_011129122.1 hypothetical protein GNI_029070 [Gregarina niphandrodes]
MQWQTVLTMLSLVCGVEYECLDAPVRVWIHQDMTSSFKWISSDPLSYIEGILTSLHDRIEDLDFGLSLFWDRSESLTRQCYVLVNELDGKDFETKVEEASTILAANSASSPSGNDSAEDPLSALPMIAKHQFGSSTKGAVNIFVIITDNWGKYHGMDGCEDGLKKCDATFEADGSALNTMVEDQVTCKKDVWYPTVDQLAHSLQAYNVVPITLVVKKYVGWWTDVWSKELKLKADQGQFGVFPITMDAEAVAQTILESVNSVNCILKTTTTTTATPTSATTSTHLPITSTFAEPDQATDNKKAIAIGGSAAGAAALLAAAAWYKIRNSPPPDLDVGEALGDTAVGHTGDRESLVAMEEDAFD